MRTVIPAEKVASPRRVWQLTLGVAAGAGLALAFDWYLLILSLVLLTILVYRDWRGGITLAIAVIVGALGAGVSQWRYFHHLPPPGYGEYRLRINDPRLSEAPGIRSPLRVRAKVTSPWVGQVNLHVPPDVHDLYYGSTLTVQGVFVSAESAGKVWMRGRGIVGDLYPEQLKIIGRSPGWYGALLQLRDRGIARATRYFTDPELRNLAAALFFGVSGGIGGEMRQSFVNSGTVHIFTVSGMHVALMAGLLMLFLRLMSPRLRAVILILGCAVYVAMTGANPPALRAGVMIAIYVGFRGAGWGIRRLDALGLAGLVLLLVNPALVADFGAQYSLVLTAALIVGAETLAQTREATARFGELAERRYRPRSGKFGSAIALTLVAVFFSIGIALAHGNVISPGQLIANIVLSAITPLVFMALIAAVILPPVGVVAQGLLALICRWCGVVSQLFAPWEFAHIAPAVAVGFYLAAFGALAGRGKLRIAALAAALILPLVFAEAALPDQLAVIGADAASPPVVVARSRTAGEATVFFAPNAKTGKVLADHLRAEGIREIESVIVSGASRSLLERFPADRRPRRVIRGRDVRPSRGRILSAKTPYRLEYFFPGSKLKVELTLYPEVSGYRIEGKTSAGETFRGQTRYNSTGFCWKQEF